MENLKEGDKVALLYNNPRYSLKKGDEAIIVYLGKSPKCDVCKVLINKREMYISLNSIRRIK